MTQHLHPEYVPGCYRCELSRDEVEQQHRMIPGSHERSYGPECRCGASWDRWADECGAQTKEETR